LNGGFIIGISMVCCRKKRPPRISMWLDNARTYQLCVMFPMIHVWNQIRQFLYAPLLLYMKQILNTQWSADTLCVGDTIYATLDIHLVLILHKCFISLIILELSSILSWETLVISSR
jgi:hypothetical protein